jgi:hypothetical protein
VHLSDVSTYNYTITLSIEEVVSFLSVLARPTSRVDVQKLKSELALKRDDLIRLLASTIDAIA